MIGVGRATDEIFTAIRRRPPGLVLAIEYRDYLSTADRLAHQKRVEAMMASDSHKEDAKSGERKVLRKRAGSLEAQELNLK